MIEYHNESVETYLVINGREPLIANPISMVDGIFSFGENDFDLLFMWVNNAQFKNEISIISKYLAGRLIDKYHKSIIVLKTDESISILENINLNEVFCSQDIHRLVSVRTLPLYTQKNE